MVVSIQCCNYLSECRDSSTSGDDGRARWPIRLEQRAIPLQSTIRPDSTPVERLCVRVCRQTSACGVSVPEDGELMTSLQHAGPARARRDQLIATRQPLPPL